MLLRDSLCFQVAQPAYNPATGQTVQPGETHAHTAADMPNQIDQYTEGWTDRRECFSEDPGYHLSQGYCRGGPVWEQGHAGYVQPGSWTPSSTLGEATPPTWDCSPSGGMDGGNLIANGNGPGLSKAQCQEACDNDIECGAFDVESHASSGLTRSECCLFKAGTPAGPVPINPATGQPAMDYQGHVLPGNPPAIPGPKGEGSSERHCWIKGTGENTDHSTRPRGHWTKTIDTTTRGVATEASHSGTGEATGVDAVQKKGHYAYDLYHTVHTGWGYVYIVELCGGIGGDGVPDGNACTTSSYGR